jgi:hypothetical protein
MGPQVAVYRGSSSRRVTLKNVSLPVKVSARGLARVARSSYSEPNVVVKR